MREISWEMPQRGMRRPTLVVRESCWRRGLECWAGMMRRNRGEELGRVPVVEATAGAKAMCHRDSPTRDGRDSHMTAGTAIMKASVYQACARSCLKPFTEVISFYLDNIPNK